MSRESNGVNMKESIYLKIKTGVSNKGTTMLETLVAFTVLMVILGVLYTVIAFCSELKMSATDINNSMQDFSVELYNNNTSKIDMGTYITREDEIAGVRRPMFYLKLSDDTNKELNGCNNIPAGYETELSLYNIYAKTYTYNQETSNVKPKAMNFVHKKDW